VLGDSLNRGSVETTGLKRLEDGSGRALVEVTEGDGAQRVASGLAVRSDLGDEAAAVRVHLTHNSDLVRGAGARGQGGEGRGDGVEGDLKCGETALRKRRQKRYMYICENTT